MSLFTRTQFKDHEGIAGTTHDNLVDELIVRVTKAVAEYLNRNVEPVTYTDAEFDGTGFTTLVVKHPPIRSITSLKITSARDFAGTSALASTGYVYDNSGVITLLPSSPIGSILLGGGSSVFTLGVRNIQVTYDGGFAAVPEDIVTAAMLWTSSVMNRRRRAGILSTTVGGETVTFSSRGVPDEARALLNQYKLYPHLCGTSL